MNQVFTVSEVNSYIKSMFMRDYALNQIYIKGEVSNCKYHTSGHIYFTLKDASGQMACVMFASQRPGLKFKMQEGQSVIALGSVNVYERDGKYQLYAREIILDGAGRLYEEYERLKRQLDTEGLFSPEHKSTIPPYSRRIGVVTAKTGAAIQDIINISKRRNPYVQLYLYPALVQGEGAKASIVKGIKALDAMDLDVIIVGRGGGSIEDLWAFNEEIVARAIYDAKTPIISAVGHETDVTIADFVADLRAPTPSAAAELAVADFTAVNEAILNYKRKLLERMREKLRMKRSEMDTLQLRLNHASPMMKVREKRQMLMEYEDRLSRGMEGKVADRRHKLAIYIEKLNGLSPLTQLNRGYAMVMKDKQVISSIKEVKKEEPITIAVKDGEIKALVTGTTRKKRQG